MIIVIEIEKGRAGVVGILDGDGVVAVELSRGEALDQVACALYTGKRAYGRHEDDSSEMALRAAEKYAESVKELNDGL